MKSTRFTLWLPAQSMVSCGVTDRQTRHVLSCENNRSRRINSEWDTQPRWVRVKCCYVSVSCGVTDRHVDTPCVQLWDRWRRISNGDWEWNVVTCEWAGWFVAELSRAVTRGCSLVVCDQWVARPSLSTDSSTSVPLHSTHHNAVADSQPLLLLRPSLTQQHNSTALWISQACEWLWRSLKVIERASIRYHFLLVVHSKSCTISNILPHLQCAFLWPWESFFLFHVTCAFRFMCKHIVNRPNTYHVSCGMEVRNVSNSKSNLQGHWRSSIMVSFNETHAPCLAINVPVVLCLID